MIDYCINRYSQSIVRDEDPEVVDTKNLVTFCNIKITYTTADSVTH